MRRAVLDTNVIVSETRLVSPALRDPKDNPILACAVEGGADYIVTGDRDLLVLERFQGIPIVSPAAFAALLETTEGQPGPVLPSQGTT